MIGRGASQPLFLERVYKVSGKKTLEKLRCRASNHPNHPKSHPSHSTGPPNDVFREELVVAAGT